MEKKELIKKFSKHVNPYMGSGMLSNTIDDEAILMQSKECVKIADQHANDKVKEALETAQADIRNELGMLQYLVNALEDELPFTQENIETAQESIDYIKNISFKLK